MNNLIAIPKEYFKEKPSLEDYIAAHAPTNMFHISFLETQYCRFMVSKNYWGMSF